MFPLQGQHGHQGSSGASTPRESGLIVWSQASLLSLEPEKQCQFSCWVDNRDQWLSIQVPRGCHSCHRVFELVSG